MSHNKECAKQERTLTSRADTQRKIVLLNKYLWVGGEEGQQQVIVLRIVKERSERLDVVKCKLGQN